MVWEVRVVEAEAEKVARKVEAEAKALRRNRGSHAAAALAQRGLRRNGVLALQDTIDALEHMLVAPVVANDAGKPSTWSSGDWSMPA
ncbi:Os01g0699750 [Oryza sativa Japonica Group]|uniref:Os01g0699750 protein n=1 Tax=Oryza sativa subsp. japonica TaxID=39947 RepID=A0A0N7KDK6_ORYSJ|nr:Os01g0699750 [Oryza sativa Japonica Group]